MTIEISISSQDLKLYQGDELVMCYLISTAANGVGFEDGSYCTPTGNFEIREKIGDGEVKQTIFKARKPVGVWSGEPCDDDLVLTRIIRLHGLDANNSNTMERYIYIHGTNHEDLLGCPASCGCVRMRNDDVIDLFDRVKIGNRVKIDPD